MKPLIFPHRHRLRIATGIFLSLLLHASLLLLLRTHALPQPESLGKEGRAPLVVQLTPPLPPAPPVPQAAPANPAPPNSQQAAPPARARPPRLAQRPAPRRPASLPLAAARPKPAPEPKPIEPETAPSPAPPADMSEMVAAARARRRAAGIAEPAEPARADGGKPQDDNAKARANIAFSLGEARGRRNEGGIFQVVRMGVRNAEFVFRGWDPAHRAGTRQFVEVDAGPDGDVELAVVRKMIAIIRSHESGDFSWESRRLGRVVTLSARREDNAGLEDFLRQEFFGARP
jgi:hypothetical protein